MSLWPNLRVGFARPDCRALYGEMAARHGRDRATRELLVSQRRAGSRVSDKTALVGYTINVMKG